MKTDLPKYVYRKGRKGYLYFTRGTTQRMHEAPGTPEFAAEYARLMAGIPQTPKAFTFHALIQSYKKSEDFSSKKPRTKRDYDKVLSYIDKALGDFDPRKMKRKDVIRVRDANKDAVRFANYSVQVLSIILGHAIDIGWIEHNPALGTKKLKSDTPPRQPWPKDMIEAFREEAPIGTRARLIFELCLGTGQRIGDVLSMRWSDLGAEGIHIHQRKTGARLVIPLTIPLRRTLGESRREGITIIAGRRGAPVSYRQASHAMMQVRKAIGAEAYDIHSLRHTAAYELAEAGCSDELIMAVTGHSSKSMVAHYAGAARQRVRAKEAQEKRR